MQTTDDSSFGVEVHKTAGHFFGRPKDEPSFEMKYLIKQGKHEY